MIGNHSVFCRTGPVWRLDHAHGSEVEAGAALLDIPHPYAYFCHPTGGIAGGAEAAGRRRPLPRPAAGAAHPGLCRPVRDPLPPGGPNHRRTGRANRISRRRAPGQPADRPVGEKGQAALSPGWWPVRGDGARSGRRHAERDVLAHPRGVCLVPGRSSGPATRPVRAGRGPWAVGGRHPPSAPGGALPGLSGHDWGKEERGHLRLSLRHRPPEKQGVRRPGGHAGFRTVPQRLSELWRGPLCPGRRAGGPAGVPGHRARGQGPAPTVKGKPRCGERHSG